MTKSTRQSRSLGDAKAHFAECVRAAENGRATILTRHGRPVARLVPIAGPEGFADWISGADGEPEASEVREHLGAYEARSLPPKRSSKARKAAIQRLLEEEIWPQVPQEMIGKAPTKEECEKILGLGEEAD